MTPDIKGAARAAFRRAEDLGRRITALYPDAWQRMDMMRTNPPQPWADWCLLPMAAAGAIVTSGPPPLPPPIEEMRGMPRHDHVSVLSALYAWRFSRSVYIFEPALLSRLLTQIPDAIEVADLADLPDWCIYLADSTQGTEFRLWMHLEHDAGNGRPELRMIIDPGGDIDDLLRIPIYLDRPSLTEALADMRSTIAQQSLFGGSQNVRGGELDADVANLAAKIEAYVGIAAYLARPEADITSPDLPGLQPARLRSPARDRRIWKVGYGAIS